MDNNFKKPDEQREKTGKSDSFIPMTESSNNSADHRADTHDKYQYFEEVPLEELDEIGLLKRMILSTDKCSDLLDHALPRLSEFNQNYMSLKECIGDFEKFSKVNFLLFNEQEKKQKDFLDKIPKQIPAEIDPEQLETLNSINKTTQTRKQMQYGMVGIFALAILFVSVCGYWGIQYYKTGIRTKAEHRLEFLQELKDGGNIIVEKKEFSELRDNTKLMKLWMKKYPRESDNFSRFKEGYQSNYQTE
jgi:hypothetical protein